MPPDIDWRISVSANGQIVAARYARELSGGLQLGIYIDTWQVETGKRLLHKEIKSIEAGWHQGQLVLNQDGSLVAQGRHPGIIEIFDTTTGKEVFRRQLPRTSSIPPKSNYELIYAPTGLAFHPVLPQIGVTVTSGCTTYIFDYKESKTLKTLYYPGSIEEINLINNCGTAFQVNLYYSPTGNWLTILNRKDAYMWNGKDYQYQGKIRIQPYPSYFHKNSSIHWNQSETKFNILYEDHFFQFTAIK